MGHASFKIKGKKAIVVTDPFDPDFIGLKFPKTEAKIVTISHHHSDHNYKEGILGEPVFIEGPGEYEIADIFIKGISSYHDNKNGGERGKNTIYKIEMDGMRLAHLGDLGHKLTDQQSDALADVDILFVPVGGVATIDAKEASEVIAQIEPRIVIPMHYKENRLNQGSFGEFMDLKDFFKEIGKEVKILPKLVISKEKLPQELEVIALE